MEIDYLTTHEVSLLIGCSDIHVTRLVKQGLFPGTRKFDPTKVNSRLRIPKAAVQAFLDRQIVSPVIEDPQQA